jgi:hypothetical protein
MIKRLAFAIGIVALIASACARVAGSGGTASQGIEGKVLLGPACPVEIQGSPCPDVPIPAEVIVNDLDGNKVASQMADKDGRFRIGLDPGTYEVTAGHLKGIQFAKPATVTVGSDAYTHVDVLVDSGIR